MAKTTSEQQTTPETALGDGQQQQAEGGDKGKGGDGQQQQQQADKGGDKGEQQQQGKGGGQSSEGDGAQAAPEKYELTLPDGGFIDDEDLTKFQDVAREAGLTNEQAQQAVDDHVNALRAQSEHWLAETKKDTEYGGKNLAETQRLANAVIERIRPDGHKRRDGFLRMVRRGGVFNNVDVVSFLADIGKLMAEDGAQGGLPAGGGKGGEKTLADKLYPSTKGLEGSND